MPQLRSTLREHASAVLTAPPGAGKSTRFTVQRLLAAPRALLVGIALFCSSLYALSLGAPPWVGVLTPIGG